MARSEENTPMGNVVRNLFPLESLRVTGGNCPRCNNPINPDSFRDELSRKEFKITGVCQACQDGFFK